jgi:hypothetical protein
MVIYTYIYIYIYVYSGGGRDLASLHPCTPRRPPPQVETLGLKLDMRHLPDGGHPLITFMMAFSSWNGVVSLPLVPSSTSVPQVRDPEVMKLRIMLQSLIFCEQGRRGLGKPPQEAS